MMVMVVIGNLQNNDGFGSQWYGRTEQAGKLWVSVQDLQDMRAAPEIQLERSINK